jgi:3-oxoacyl-[acyl-carrier protein] reductase
MRLENKKIIVTGAGSGFGAAMARSFVAEGAQVLVADINGDGMADNLTDYLRTALDALRAGRGAP